MNGTTKFAYAAPVFFVMAMCFPELPAAKDIKKKVMKETVLDEQIRAFCALRCVGNERQGKLKSLTIDPLGKDRYYVFGIAALRNREVMKNPFEYVVFDHTVYISSRGTLNSETCMLKVEDAKVDNDYHGIFTQMLRSESDVIGKTFKVPDCHRFIE